MNTLISALTIVQLACVGVLAWIAVTAIQGREAESKRAEHNYAAGQIVYEAICMYMSDQGLPEPDEDEMSVYITRAITESLEEAITESLEENDQPE